MKKIGLITICIFVAFFSFISALQTADAVVSKVAGQAAKKVAKEVIKDAAINTALNMTINFVMPPDQINKHKAVESGYDAVCLPKDGKKDPTCSKPAQIKVPKTASEKKVLADTAEMILDRKLGMSSGWAKFLDWFVPIFLVGGAVTWLETTFDPETEDLFDEVAREALEETEAIKQLQGDHTQTPTDFIDYSPTNGIVTAIKDKVYEFNIVDYPAGYISFQFNDLMPLTNGVAIIDIISPVSGAVDMVDGISITRDTLFKTFMSYQDETFGHEYRGQWQGTSSTSSYTRKIYYNSEPFNVKSYNSWRNDMPDGIPLNVLRDVRRVIIEYPFVSANGYKTRVSYISANGSVLHTSGEVENLMSNVNLKNKLDIAFTLKSTFGRPVKMRIGLYPDKSSVNLEPYKPSFKDVNVKPLDMSVYKNVNGTINVLPGSAVPFVKPDGKVVYWNNNQWTDIKGTPDPNVDEDTLKAKDPEATPEGFPLPGPGDNKLPPPQPPGETGDEDPPDQDKEREQLEDESKKLGSLVTSRFPFSLPWDFLALVKLLYAEPMAPKWEVKGTDDIPLNFTIDLKFLDPYIGWFRGFVMIGFVVSVIFMHGRFMGGSK